MNISMKIVIVLLMSTSFLFANKKPSPNTQLQVNAPSGLKLRLDASMQSPVLEIMPHGSYVTITEFDSCFELQRIDWIDGTWVKVDYNGIQGWAFDGFLTSVELPDHELTRVYEDLDFLYPMDNWLKSTFHAQKMEESQNLGMMTRTEYQLDNQQSMVIKYEDFQTTMEIILHDVRVMEVYQILQSMIEPIRAQDFFRENSVFIEKNGTVNLVKINSDHPIKIQKLSDGRVKINITSNYGGC